LSRSLAGNTHACNEQNKKQRGADSRAYSQGGKKMTEQAQNLVGQIQEQVQQTAQDFFGDSLGEIKNQLATHRSQLQELIEMLPESQEEGRAQLEQLLNSYEELENSLDEVAQEQGLQEMVNQAAQQAQEGTEQAQEGAEQATEQAQEGAEQAQEEAEEGAEQAQQATEQAQ
jgi:methyl-accepting chemotaxis protein